MLHGAPWRGKVEENLKMRYRVAVGRKVYEYTDIIEVDADSVEEAERRAIALAQEEAEDMTWQFIEQPDYFISDLETRPDLSGPAAAKKEDKRG
jgi:hypothetical protein